MARVWLWNSNFKGMEMIKAETIAATLDRESDSLSSNVKYSTAKQAAKELRRLAAIEQAALKLVKCKGRYHTEQNMIALGELLGVVMPPMICKKPD